MTVQQFALKPPLERMAVIDRLWDAIVEWVAPNQTAQQMMDPDAGNPVHNVISARRSNAFRQLGIGFRCEKDTDLGRILQHGFQPLYSLPEIAATLGQVVRGTVTQMNTALGKLGLWRVNQDAIGARPESAWPAAPWGRQSFRMRAMPVTSTCSPSSRFPPSSLADNSTVWPVQAALRSNGFLYRCHRYN